MPDTETRREVRLPAQRLAAAPSTYNAESHTVELVAATGFKVKRYDWDAGYYMEQLDVSEAAVDLSRLDSGVCPLLDAHSSWSINDQLGTVVGARFDKAGLNLTVQFGQSEAARAAEAQVAAGTVRGVSVGYRRDQMIKNEPEDGQLPTFVVSRWALLEVSLVPIPADPASGVRTEDGLHPCLILSKESRAMPQETTAAGAPAVIEAARTDPLAAPAAPAAPATPTVARFTAAEALDFVDQARTFGVDAEARVLVDTNEKGEITPEAARAAIMKAAADKQRAATATAPAMSAGRTEDSQAVTRGHIVDAIFARATRQAPPEAAREYMGWRLLDIARERAGINPRERDVNTIMRMAMTTSDFPLLLEAAANKVLLAAYTAAPPTYQEIAKRRDLTDFKASKILRVGDFPTLLPYLEDGEIKDGYINEGRETVTLASYGRIVRLTRQAIVNDDLGAFDDVFSSIGRMVARFENATFYTMKALNSGNGPTLADSVAVFNSAHGNLAGSGAAIDITTLGAARAAMRVQTDLDGNVLNLVPKILLTGAATETVAEQYMSQIQPIVGSAVNPFAGKFRVISEGLLTGNSWELYADPNDAPVFVYGYLADAPGPQVMQKSEFDTDGIAYRVTLDFYADAIDYRGAYRNPGA